MFCVLREGRRREGSWAESMRLSVVAWGEIKKAKLNWVRGDRLCSWDEFGVCSPFVAIYVTYLGFRVIWGKRGIGQNPQP